jgi:predicted negative regulator of RcsB-dependent stress response
MKKFVSDNAWWLISVSVIGVAILLYKQYKEKQDSEIGQV